MAYFVRGVHLGILDESCVFSRARAVQDCVKVVYSVVRQLCRVLRELCVQWCDSCSRLRESCVFSRETAVKGFARVVYSVV